MKALLASFLIVLVIICSPGCIPTQSADLTAAQKLVQNERTVKVATGLAVRAVLLSVDQPKANGVAAEINRIAKVVEAASTSGTIDLTSIRTLVSTEAAKITDVRVRTIVSSAVETIIPIVETQIEARLAAASENERVAAIRSLVSSAAQGAIEATEVWMILSPATTTTK